MQRPDPAAIAGNVSRQITSMPRGRPSGRIIAIGFGLTALLAPILLAPSPRLIWNASASAPVGLYLVTPGTRLHEGDMAIARLPEPFVRLAAGRRYLPANVPLVKRVVAGPGRRVCALGDGIFIDGLRVANRRRRDPHGRLLPWWSGCETLNGHRYLLVMDAPDSFDGRYFGPLEECAIIGPATPLWLR